MGKSRLLRFALPLAAVLLVFVVYDYGYRGIRDDLEMKRDEESVKAATLEKYKRLVMERPELDKRLAGMNVLRKETELKLLPGQTEALAGANLQDILKDMIPEGTGAVNSIQMARAQEEGGFKVVIVSVDATLSDVEALTRLLYAVETSLPYLRVKGLEVRVLNVNKPRELYIRMQVAGLSRART